MADSDGAASSWAEKLWWFAIGALGFAMAWWLLAS